MLVYAEAELVLGLVAPVGTDFTTFTEKLEVVLREYRYDPSTIRLAELARSFKVGPVDQPPEGTAEYVRLTELMNLGNAARKLGDGGAVLALSAAAKIASGRTIDDAGHPGPRPRAAHILRSLKHPGEVQMLRRIYGPGFFLIGVVASESQRRDYLKVRRGCTDAEVDQLFLRDGREADDLGQRTRDTFHLADAFVSLDDTEGLNRFLRLVFGHPYETPQPDEYAMFLAFSAALRSGDLSRQVGAVVMSKQGDILSVGNNDVPKAGGGLCWPGKDDHRDHVRGEDMNERQRKQIVDEILGALAPEGEEREQWVEEGWTKLRSAAVMDITEYGRAVHAEMEALLACARAGISPVGTTLFSTTFPCHNCAKHILAAGVTRVVYVEPYPKSQAIEMYPESITEEASEDGVTFEAFRGVGPRRFFDLFSVGLSTGYVVKRKVNGRTRPWSPGTAEIRVPLLPNSYIAREHHAVTVLQQLATHKENSP